MAVTISSPANSFIKFNQPAFVPYCEDPGVRPFVFPVVENADVAFQFFLVADTPAEADAICASLDASDITIGLGQCDTPGLQVTFPGNPARYRLNETTVRFDWEHGLQGAVEFYDILDCFNIKVLYGASEWCSAKKFQIIPDGCFTSVIDYGNEENFAGFSYCAGGVVDGGDVDTCLPDVFEFLNQATLTIPYTSQMLAKWGPAPNVQIWIFNEFGELQQMGVQAKLDAYPPTVISLDFGGNASGYVRIK